MAPVWGTGRRSSGVRIAGATGAVGPSWIARKFGPRVSAGGCPEGWKSQRAEEEGRRGWPRAGRTENGCVGPLGRRDARGPAGSVGPRETRRRDRTGTHHGKSGVGHAGACPEAPGGRPRCDYQVALLTAPGPERRPVFSPTSINKVGARLLSTEADGIVVRDRPSVCNSKKLSWLILEHICWRLTIRVSFGTNAG